MVKLLALFLLPVFIFRRTLDSSRFVMKVRLQHYRMIGANVAPSVKIQANVELLGCKKITVGPDSFIGSGTKITAYDAKVIIGANVLIAPGCFITSRNHNYESVLPIRHQGYTAKQIVIEDDVWLGAGVVVLPGIVIGKGAVVAARSVINKNVEPYTVVGGVPAKFIKKRLKE